MTTIDNHSTPPASGPIRLPKRKLPPLLDIALPAVALCSGAMLFMAVPNIVAVHDVWSTLKAGTLALSATAVSFGINKLAIERGAPLATTGYLGAGFTSVVSILLVGSGLFAATYSGLVFKDTAELRLQEHGTELAEFVGDRSASASKAGRVNPAIASIATDLNGKLACELGESCISGRGNGTRGPVARAIGELAGRAASIGEQFTAGEASRQEAAAALTAALGEYQRIAGDSTRNVWERRTELQAADARIRQGVSRLDEAVPLPLATAYAGELQAGTSIPGRPEAEARLNAILRNHGQSLAGVTGGIGADSAVAPAFPRRTGVSDTFRYLAHFLPIAAIAAVVELIFPLVLWAYTVWAMSWEKYKLQPPVDAHEPRELPTSATPPALAIEAQPTPVLSDMRRTARRNGRAMPTRLDG